MGRWMRKRQGSAMDVLPPVVCMLALSIVMLAYLNIMELVNRREDVGQIARQYILRMETAGCLGPQDRAAMLHALAEAGLESVTLDGTTLSGAGYGNPVVLCISGELAAEGVAGGSLFRMAFARQAFRVRVTKMSTAKN
ncbi:MAG: hypothetical protein LBQ15_02385 [Clostridium sp.]|nr:hypothetical protein [Clostridium sp.]